MKLLTILLSVLSLNAHESPVDGYSSKPNSPYSTMTHYDPQLSTTQKQPYPQLSDYWVSDGMPEPSAPPAEDHQFLEQSISIPMPLSAPSNFSPPQPTTTDFYKLLLSGRTNPPTPSVSTHDADSVPYPEKTQLQLSSKQPKGSEEELVELRQRNASIEQKIALQDELLRENHKMLRAILTALESQGIQMEGIENGQIQIEDNLMSMMNKLKRWKTEVMQSQEHPVAKVLRWFKLGFNVSASTGAALSTYYTIAWFAAILPGAITPPGWILIATSAATGAVYYLAFAV